MKTCNKCGYQNTDDSNKCKNCMIDLHWAKVNLGKFTGTLDDTKRIGEEERKQRGIKSEISETMNSTSIEKPFSFMKATGIGAIVGYISFFMTIIWIYIGLGGTPRPFWESISVANLLSLFGVPFGVAGALIGKFSLKTSRAVWIGAFIFVCPAAALLFYLIASI